MQLGELKSELATSDHIVIEFIPVGQCCQPGAREFGEGTEIQAITPNADIVHADGQKDKQGY